MFCFRHRKAGCLTAACCALLLLLALLLTACAENPGEQALSFSERSVVGHMPLSYARQFQVDYYEDGAALLTVAGTDRYYLLPQDTALPAALPDDVRVICLPVQDIYLASSSAADLFVQAGALDHVRMTSTSQTNWRLAPLQQAMEEGRLLYAGKYSAPDFERILVENCTLAIENTMIFHNPEIREKLETLGIPVLVEYSSYEPHPLGRVEWIKLYGLLTGKREQAEAFFAQQEQIVAPLAQAEKSGKTVVFFYINSNGTAVVRKPGDYVSKMIELAGGSYAFSDLPQQDNALSTLNMQMESFYAQAREADVLIYNSTTGAELYSMEQLLEKSALLSEFKAVQQGKVWCTEQSMFQQSSAVAGMIADIHAVLSDTAQEDALHFLHRLR